MLSSLGTDLPLLLPLAKERWLCLGFMYSVNNYLFSHLPVLRTKAEAWESKRHQFPDHTSTSLHGYWCLWPRSTSGIHVWMTLARASQSLAARSHYRSHRGVRPSYWEPTTQGSEKVCILMPVGSRKRSKMEESKINLPLSIQFPAGQVISVERGLSGSKGQLQYSPWAPSRRKHGDKEKGTPSTSMHAFPLLAGYRKKVF